MTGTNYRPIQRTLYNVSAYIPMPPSPSPSPLPSPMPIPIPVPVPSPMPIPVPVPVMPVNPIPVTPTSAPTSNFLIVQDPTYVNAFWAVFILLIIFVVCLVFVTFKYCTLKGVTDLTPSSGDIQRA